MSESGDVNNTISPAYAAVVRDVRYHSVAGLTLLVWHCFLTFDEDVHYIWTMRNKNPLKWVYFFLRYVVILACLTHTWLIGRLADGSNPRLLCSVWQAYVPAFSQILSSLLELILAIRKPTVFALYNRSRRIGFLLSVLILAEVAGTVRLLWLQNQKGLRFYQVCLLVELIEDGKYQSLLVFIVHCVLIGLTLFKYFLAFRKGWNRAPLVSLVVRDGSTMYGTISFLFFALLVICGFENERENAFFFWVVSLFTISGCRMILSMERFARREMAIDYPIFTSQLSIGTFESTRQTQSAL